MKPNMMWSKEDHVKVNNWGEALWHKKGEVAFGLVCIGFTFLMYALGARDSQVMGGVLSTSSLCLIAIPLGVGLKTAVDVMRWGYAHIPDKDRMDIIKR